MTDTALGPDAALMRHGFALLMVLLFVAGCFRGDWWMVVENRTEQTIFVRAPSQTNGAQDYSVARVEPGAAGPAVAWRGERDMTVEVLDQACERLGAFASEDGQVYLVEELPGLEGWIEPWRAIGGNQTPGIVDSEECGGMVLR